MDKTFISFVAPFYNVNLYLEEFLNSFKHLDKSKYELILVDDCGEDASSIISKFTKELPINLVKNDKNIGLGPARNRGVEKSSKKSTHIMFVDSDDRISKDFKIEEIPEDKIYYYKNINFWTNKETSPYWKQDGYYTHLQLKGFIWGIAFPIRVIKEYPFDRREWEDMVVLSQIGNKYDDKFELRDIVCVEYRNRISSISGQTISTLAKNEGYYGAFCFVVEHNLIKHNKNRYIGRFIESQYFLPKDIRIIEKNMLQYPNWKRILRKIAVSFQKVFYFNLNKKDNYFE